MSTGRGRLVLAVLAGSAAAAGGATVHRYRRDLNRARARLATVERRVIPTASGRLEYAERGDGAPLLVVHGLLHGCDGGLLSVRDLAGDRRVIAPSRFGYLGSTLPPEATPADQADAYTVLLDHLGIGRTDVIGISAGSTSALQLALRHPDRVAHLAIISGNLPGSPTAAAPGSWARVFYADPVMWALRTFVPALFNRAIGVPAGFVLTPDDARTLAELSDSFFPIAPRAPGSLYDVFVSNADVNGYRLESLTVPTLLLHSADDPLTSYDAARRAAERILGAVFVGFESGGHLGLGQEELVRGELAAFFSVPLAA